LTRLNGIRNSLLIEARSTTW